MKQIKFAVIKIKPELQQALNVIYIGRKYVQGKYNLKRSPLANRYQVRKNGSNREQAIATYKKWLWAEIHKGKQGKKSKAYKELMKIIEYQKRFSGVVYLAGWENPKTSHGNIIIKALEHLSNHHQ